MMTPTLPHNISRWPSLAALTVVIVLAAACAPGGRSGEESASAQLTSSEYVAGLLEQLAAGEGMQLLDLTYPLSPDSIYWPTGAPFDHQLQGWEISEGGYWYASASFSSPEHLGTHIDAPIHFAESGWTLAEIPVDRLVGPGVLIDISERSAMDPDAALEVEDIERWEGAHGAIPASSIVIVRSGWAQHWPDWNAYYGTDTPEDVSTLHFPGVSESAAEVLVERRIAGVGIDTASIDPGVSTLFEAHQVLCGANVFNLENLANLDELPEVGFVVFALPMKIANGTGAPTRVVALLPTG